MEMDVFPQVGTAHTHMRPFSLLTSESQLHRRCVKESSVFSSSIPVNLNFDLSLILGFNWVFQLINVSLGTC